MALIQCAECGKPMSQHAAACPHCGSPNTAAQQPQPQQPQQWQQQQMQPTQAAPVAEEKPLVNNELASIMLLGYIAIWLFIIILFEFWDFPMYSYDSVERLIYYILSNLPCLGLPIVALTIKKPILRNIALGLSIILFGLTAYNIFNIYVLYK